jgi:acetyl esterase/lipase
MRGPGLILAAALAVQCCRSDPAAEPLKMKTRTESEPMKKLRILCLHGYHGSAGVLRDQMASLAGGMDSLAEFVYIDAPSLAAGDFGWWHAVAHENAPDEEDPGVGPGQKHYKGWNRTREAIVSVFSRQGPFDGVFGFSQGAALTGLLTGLRAPDGKPTAAKPLAFDFAVMAGGFLGIDTVLARMYGDGGSYDLPSAHIIGRSDFIVPPEDSRRLAGKFKDPLILEHAGGHVIAGTPEIRKRFASFLEDMLRRKRTRGGPEAVPGSMPVSQSIEVPLWPGRAHPAMKVVFPKAGGPGPRRAMLVFQGGAYAGCMGSGGGSAEWAAEQGMVGIRVEYGTRSTDKAYPENYSDAARAVRLVRSKAAEWGIDPKRIGAMGYSAGGHLVSLLSTQPDLYRHPGDDLAEAISARPDLVVLAYPVISFVDGYSPGAFVGSAENFFGHGGLGESLRRGFSNELHVDAKHPPVFIWTTRDDGLVPYTHSQLFAEACRRAKVPVAYTLYSHGPHGMGLAIGAGEAGEWTSLLLAWLKGQWGEA